METITILDGIKDNWIQFAGRIEKKNDYRWAKWFWSRDQNRLVSLMSKNDSSVTSPAGDVDASAGDAHL